MKDRNTRYNRKRAPIWSDLLLTLLLVTFLFSAAVVIVLNFRPLYWLDIKLLGIEQLSGRGTKEILQNYDTLIRYNQFWYQGPLVFPTLPMSETARIHFQEVKVIFVIIQYLCMGSGILSLVGILLKHRQEGSRYLKLTAVLAILIPVVLGGLAILCWDDFFITFHHIFFRNNYWLFYPETDPVILMLPDGYFLHCALAIVLLILAGSLVCFKIGRRKSRKRENRYGRRDYDKKRRS